MNYENQHIVFDLDGTLITCQERQMTLLQSILKTYSYRFSLDDIWDLKQKGLSIRECLEKIGFSKNHVQAISNRWIGEIETPYWLSLDTCYAETQSVLKRLSESQTKLTLLTARKNSYWLNQQLRHLGLIYFFERVISVLPATAVDCKTRELALLRPDLYIGDTEIDYLSAINSGIQIKLVSHGQRSKIFLNGSTRIVCYDNLSCALNF